MLKVLPSSIDPADVTAVVDTREQAPFDLSPMKTERATLTTGDYSIKSLEHIVAIERKSLPDLVQCVGRDRKRFVRELQRLKAFPVSAVIVESTWSTIESGSWKTPQMRISPNLSLIHI